MSASYIPERGDFVWITLNPQAGHEQAGRRPAVVLSPRTYNKPSGLALFCPSTNRTKVYPFEVHLSEQSPVTGVVLVDQLRSLDWQVRHMEFIGELDAQTLAELFARLRPLMELEDE
jgi:mRNA interferase MazF